MLQTFQAFLWNVFYTEKTLIFFREKKMLQCFHCILIKTLLQKKLKFHYL